MVEPTVRVSWSTMSSLSMLSLPEMVTRRTIGFSSTRNVTICPPRAASVETWMSRKNPSS